MSPSAVEEPQDVKCRRSTSLSHFPDPLAFSAKDLDSPLRRKLPPDVRARKAFESGKVEEQQFVLRMRGVTGAAAAMLLVEVVVADMERSRWSLRLETAKAEEARWVLGIGEAGVQTGMHLFHFAVGGERLLSSDHPVFGDCNAVLFSEPIRKYILAREISGHASQVHPQVPVGRAITHALVHDRPQDTPEGRRAAQDDGEVRDQQKGNMARPWSCAFNLSALGDEEEELLETTKNVTNFSKEVFEGLYDAELRLRIDNYVLPEVQVRRGKEAAPPKFALWRGAHLLKKKVGACEDAYFSRPHALGVADGVGCMVQFASYGINAAAYAAELMEHACAALQPEGVAGAGTSDSVEARAAAAIAAAESRAEAYGASTITVLVLEGNTAGVANLGDSGFMLLRKAQRGMAVVKKSEEQQHSWNCPFQLTRLPPALISRFPKVSLDTAADCELYSFEVQEGDLLLLFTDGVRDNLHEREILHIVDCALPPAFGELVGLPEFATPPENIARALAMAAQERSLDPVAKVPFVEYSKRHGYQCMGGKQDDITVVAAWVMPEQWFDNGGRALPVPAPAGAQRAAERAAAAAATAALEEVPPTAGDSAAPPTGPSGASGAGAGVEGGEASEEAEPLANTEGSAPAEAAVSPTPTDGDSAGAAEAKEEPASSAGSPAPSEGQAAPKSECAGVPQGPPAARLHKGHSRKFEGKYDTPRRAGSGYEQPPHPAAGAGPAPAAAAASASGAAGAVNAAPGSTKGRPPQCRAEFRPMSSSKQAASKGRAGSGGGRRLET